LKTFVDDFLWLNDGLPYSPCRFYNSPIHKWIEQACSGTCPPYDHDYHLHNFIFSCYDCCPPSRSLNKGRRSLFRIHIEHMLVLREIERTCLFHYTLSSLYGRVHDKIQEEEMGFVAYGYSSTIWTV
jgi:hypothetical protein